MSLDEKALRAWIERAISRPVKEMSRLTGGASRVSFRVNCETGPSLLLRVDTGAGPLSGTRYDLAREYKVLKALDTAGYAVPTIYAFSAEHQALLMGYVDGFNSYQHTLPPAAQSHQQRELLQRILELQALPTSASGLVDASQWPRLGDALEQELSIWERLYRERVSDPQPVLAFCWRWLREQMPDVDQPSTLVHGDLGPGNFLFNTDGKILALIDWELVHVGHPLEDLACVLCRALGAPFGDPATLVRWYEELTGQPVNRTTLSYAIVLVLTRWSVGINMALSRLTAELDVPMLLMFRQSNLHALMTEIGAHYNLSVPEPLSPSQEPQPEQPLYDYLIDNLSEVIAGRVEDSFVSHRLAGLAQLTRYLSALANYGNERYLDEERHRTEQLLCRSFADYRAARQALASTAENGDGCSDRDLVAHLLWWVGREQQVMASAMGPMADRRITI